MSRVLRALLLFVPAGVIAACGAFSSGDSQPGAPLDGGGSQDAPIAPPDAPVGLDGGPGPDGGPLPARRASNVSMGVEHACLVRDDGALFCWGRNDFGQLGHGTRDDVATPTRVALGPAKSVVAGLTHSCALTVSGTVFCWGANGAGQLGGFPGAQISQPPPLPVDLGGTAEEIATGGQHTCARLSGGVVKCWGLNGAGQVWPGIDGIISKPFEVPIGTDVVQMALGRDFSCARYAAGNVRCWGSNEQGQLGVPPPDGGTPSPDGGTQAPLADVVFPDAAKAEQISAGLFTACAVRSDRGVVCWGYGGYGSIGDGAKENRPTAVRAQISSVARVAVGSRHTCAAMVDGSIKCWGTAERAQLGDGTSRIRVLPDSTVTSPAEPLDDLVAGGDGTCALSKAGKVRCWGDNGRGQLGLGGASYVQTPKKVPGVAPSHLALGQWHACGRFADGVRCWGSNGFGELGTGDTLRRGAPGDLLASLGPVSALSASDAITCAVGTSVHCWGDNQYGQLGIGLTDPYRTAPAAAVGSIAATQLSAGDVHVCGIVGGKVRCWGSNANGGLGVGDVTLRRAPGPEVSLAGTVTSLAVGRGHTCAVHGNNVSCWGLNGFGQLGVGTFDRELSPRPVTVGLPASQVAQVSAGFDTSCATTTTGALWCWGYNGYGQLGIGNTLTKAVPTTVPLDQVAQVEVGTLHACARKSSGEVYCWGAASKGQLGIGSYAGQSSPKRVIIGDPLSPVMTKVIFAGANGTCALNEDGSLYCWGDNGQGQLGLGAPFTDGFVPADVPTPQDP